MAHEGKKWRGGRGIRLVALGAGSALVVSSALCVIAIRLSASYADLARREVDNLITQDLDHITTGVYNLVAAEGESFSNEMVRSLGVARAFLERSGGMVFAGAGVEWRARDQFSSSVIPVVLPRASVGGSWLGQNDDPLQRTPFVDDVADLLGATVTLFQRMNERGDMLRVATTVIKPDGRRAVGTYLPVVQQDGIPNPVVFGVLSGNRFVGRAMVLDGWYLTAYEALRSPEGRVEGMLYVGKPQEDVESRIRAAIEETRTGESGYVFVVSGRGEHRGRYVISRRGERDGEDLWDLVDPDGRFVTREVVDAALRLSPGELATVRYRWKTPGDASPRWKIARVAYYAPWDWVIGACAYEDELNQVRAVLESGRLRMSGLMIAAAAATMFVAAVWSLLLARGIARPLAALAASARDYARAGEWSPVRADSYEEVASLFESFDAMALRIKDTLRVLRSSEEKYRSLFENAQEGIFRSSLNGAFLDANPALARMLGYDDAGQLKDAIGDVGEQLYVRREERERILQDVIQTGISLGREAYWRRAGRDPFWVSINAWALRRADGSVCGLEGFATDIDARRRSEDALRATLAQKEALLREVHHRVKNNLQILLSLLGLEERSSGDSEAVAALGRFSDRVRTLSRIHEFVYASPDLNSVDMGKFVRNSASGFFQMHRSRFSEVGFVVEGEAPVLCMDQAVPCGLLIDEILSNAFRHAFPPEFPGPGTISVRFAVLDDDRLEIRVSDDGVGLPDEVEPGEGGRLGMALIPVLARQIGAELSLLRGQGATYVVRFFAASAAECLTKA
jgi:PAS domain S-box-containing protein